MAQVILCDFPKSNVEGYIRNPTLKVIYSIDLFSSKMSCGTLYCCVLCLLALNVCLFSVLATNTSCPTWHYYNNATGQCECGYRLVCSSDGNQVEIRNGYCVTSSGIEDDYYIGNCPFRHATNSTNRMYSEMPSNASQLDEVMCGPYNRRGLLCGECKDGYGPAVYSFDLKCAKCSSQWSKHAISLYIFLQFVPTTLIFICLVVFRINITSGPLLGYVLFCQSCIIGVSDCRYYIYDYIVSNAPAPLKVLFVSSITVSQFWSLQFFNALITPFCISSKLNSIHIHMLNFVPSTYSIFLVITACILIKLHARNCPSAKIIWKIVRFFLNKFKFRVMTTDDVFHALASFILLSNTSILFSTYGVVHFTYVHDASGILRNKVFFIYPKYKWLSVKTIPYILIAAVPFTFISVIPSLLLCIYPTRVYRYLSRFLSARKRLAITAFAEALHSCFKDGLNGTRDYRGLAGAMLFIFFLNPAVEGLIEYAVGYGALGPVGQVMLMLLVCVVSYIKPCKTTVANISLSFHMALFAILICAINLWENDLSVGTYTLELTITFILLSPHILVALWAGYTLTKYTLTRFGYQFHGPGCKVALSDMANGVRLCLCRRRRDYQELDEQ